MPGRNYTSSNYRYGFNGKENDNEVKGTGNQQDYGMRIYDPRLGKFLSVDPLTKSYPELTPYQFASNTPIVAIDLDGLEKYIINQYRDNSGFITKITIVSLNDSKNNIINQKIVHNGVDYSKKDYLVIDYGANEKPFNYKGIEDKSKLNRIQKEVDEKNAKPFQFKGANGKIGAVEGIQNEKDGQVNVETYDIEANTFSYDFGVGTDSKFAKQAAGALNKNHTLGGAKNKMVDEFKYDGKNAAKLKGKVDPLLTPNTKEKEIESPVKTGTNKVTSAEYEIK